MTKRTYTDTEIKNAYVFAWLNLARETNVRQLPKKHYEQFSVLLNGSKSQIEKDKKRAYAQKWYYAQKAKKGKK